MATDKPRFTITLEPALWETVDRYRQEAGFRTQSGAIQALVRRGVEALEAGGVLAREKKTPPLSEEAVKAARTFDGLDGPGRRAVRVVLADQKRRVTEERAAARSQARQGEEGPARVIPLYFTPAAAGYVSPVFGDEYDYIEVGGDVPAWADFAVKVEGDSMEPWLMDGATAYVNRDPLENGDVGIFYLEGDMLCKQYLRDEEGNVRLRSLNRARADADRYIPADSEVRMVCYGRVILPPNGPAALGSIGDP